MLNRRGLLLGTAALAGYGSTGNAHGAEGGEGPVRNTVQLRVLQAGSGPVGVSLGRPFVAGEIAHAPQVMLDGRRLPTQAEVRTRWPDGSVQHATLAFLLPHGAGDSVTLGFADQPSVAAQPLSTAEMLDPAYDFDAVMRITRDGTTEQVSARAMLQAGSYTVWAAGPVATTIILADHSPARRWDMGGAPLRPLRPIFHATFWPARKTVVARVIAEVANTDALTDLRYDVQVTIGAAAPRLFLRQDGLSHYAATRWARCFWTGTPPAQVAIDHNLRYLGATRSFPRFDTSLKVPERALARDWAHWQAAPKGLYDAGLWGKYMPGTGGRDDLGPYPAQVVRWLYTGDPRLAELVAGQAELAAAWPLIVREGNPAKRFDAAQTVPAIGRPLSVYARPTLWLLDDRDHSRPEDRVRVRGPRILTNTYPKTSGGWEPDGSHQPDPYSALYTLTGDYFALEQLQFWAASQILRYDPAYKGLPPSAAIVDQVRGDAWVLRTRVHAAFLSPDGTPEKAYFTAALADGLAYWEGVHGVTGTAFEGNRAWRAGHSRAFEPPLHIFEDQPTHRGQGVRFELASTTGALWEHYMLIFELGRAKEKGFPTGALLNWVGQVLTGQFAEAPAYDPRNLARYWTPVRDQAGGFFRHWVDTLAAYTDPHPQMPPDVGDGYAAYAYGASTMLADRPDGAKVYAWLRENFYDRLRPRYAENPKWAFLPRS